jgi:hypothetical protein
MPEWDDELNGVLNLNHARLKANRRQALDAVLTTLKRLNSRGDGWSHRSIRGQLVNWASRDRDGRSIPFCGIVIWFLEKKLKV